LLKQRRSEIHGRIARAIEELYAGRLNEHYELLAHHYERSGDVAKEVQYLILAGEKANQNNAVQAASEFFKKALEASENSSISLDPETEVRVRQGLAESSYGLGDIDTALEEYKKVVATTRKHNMVDHEMGNLSELAMVMWMSPITIMKDQAIRFFEEGIARAREVGDKSAESRILSVKGLYRCALGHRYHGNQIIADAEQLALKSEDMETIAYNRIVHSISERWLGRPQKAIELTEGMTEAMRDMVNLNSLSGLIFIRGIALSEFGRIEEGIALLRTGVDICEKYGFMTNLVRLYNSLGYCYGEVHNPDKAWQFNLKSEESARKLMEQYPMGRETSAEVVAQANVNLMENLFDQGNPDAAWDRMKSFKEETKSDDYIRARDRWEVRMDYLTSQILLLRNDVDQAKSLIQKNLEIIRREHSRKMEGGFLRLLGNIQFRRNESDNAIATLKEAIHLLKEVGNPRHLWQTHATLASTFDKLGRLSEKREQWQAAMAVVESTADELKDEGLKTTFINAAPIREIIERASR
jgi:tetratricopeptide (TPR) repeat protein